MTDLLDYERLAVEYRERHGSEISNEAIESAFMSGWLSCREEMEAEHERALEEQSNRYQAVIEAIRENPSLKTVILSEEVRPTYKVVRSHDIETGSETTSFEYRKLH